MLYGKLAACKDRVRELTEVVQQLQAELQKIDKSIPMYRLLLTVINRRGHTFQQGSIYRGVVWGPAGDLCLIDDDNQLVTGVTRDEVQPFTRADANAKKERVRVDVEYRDAFFAYHLRAAR